MCEQVQCSAVTARMQQRGMQQRPSTGNTLTLGQRRCQLEQCCTCLHCHCNKDARCQASLQEGIERQLQLSRPCSRHSNTHHQKCVQPSGAAAQLTLM